MESLGQKIMLFGVKWGRKIEKILFWVNVEAIKNLGCLVVLLNTVKVLLT